MRPPRHLASLAAAAALLVPACAGPGREGYVPPPRKEAVTLNSRAAAAFRQGRLENAAALYEEALRLSRSIEHQQGIAVNLLNLAAVHRAAGRPAEAHRALDELLAEGPVRFPETLTIDAAYLKALVLLDEGNREAGRAWATHAVGRCRETKCGREGKLTNLMARIASLDGDQPRARALARAALSLNRARDDREEIANSLRVDADALFESGRFPEAASRYREALAIDKERGLGRKIALDLRGLGRTAREAGDRESARGFFLRALEVSRSGGDAAGAAADTAAVKALAP